jgi:hypothetical protein
MRSKRINLHDPAEAIRFIGFFVHAESLVRGVPQIAESCRRNAVALLDSGLASVLPEISVEIFFAGEVGTPGGIAHGAIVKGTQHAPAGRIVAGHQSGIARCRPPDLDRGHTRNTAGEARGPHNIPLASTTSQVKVTTGPIDYFNNRHTVRVQRLVGLLLGPVVHPVREQQSIVRILVILYDQAAL